MLINKKMLLCFFSFSVVFISILNCFDVNASKKTGADNMIVYSVNSTIFREFINNPSLESLNKQKSGMTVQYFSVLNGSGKRIKRETIKDDVIQTDEGESGVMRIGSLPVYIEFIEFMKNVDNLKCILEKNGVYDDIECHLVIDNQFSDKIPLSIWIKTASGNYFLTINELLEDYTNNPNSTEFVYRFYEYKSYREKFGLNNGSLVVNGEDITDGNYVKFENDTVYLPFRAVMEKLGYTVGWDEKNSYATFSNKSGIEYILRIYVYPNLVEKSNATSLGYVPPGTDVPFCGIINNRTVVDDRLMKEITSILFAAFDVDYDSMTVTINN